MTDKLIICGEKEICQWLGVGAEGLRKLRAEGLPHAHAAGRIWIHTGEVARWFQRKCQAQGKKGRTSTDPAQHSPVERPDHR